MVGIGLGGGIVVVKGGGVVTVRGGVKGSGVSAAQAESNATAINAGIAEAHERGLSFFLDGYYEIAGQPISAKLDGTSIICGSGALLRQQTSAIPVLQFGGYLSSIQGALSLHYVNAQATTGNAVAKDGVNGANCLELWNAIRCQIGTIRTYRGARGLCLPTIGGGNVPFDNFIANLDVNFPSYRGVEYIPNGGGSTQSTFGRMAVRGQGLSARTDMNIPVLIKGSSIHVDTMNIEHMRHAAIASADSENLTGMISLAESRLTVGQIHYEGVEPVGDNRALVFAQSDGIFQAGVTELHDLFALSANGASNVWLSAVFGSRPDIDMGHISERFTGTGHDGLIEGQLGLAYATGAVTDGNIEIGRIQRGEHVKYVANTAAAGERVLRSIDGKRRTFSYATGRYYTSDNDANTAFAVTPSRLYAHRVTVTEPVTIDQLAVNVTAAGAGSEVLLGVYAVGTGNQPGKLVASSPKVGTAATGLQTGALATPAVIRPGEYWLATIANGTAPSLTSVSQTVANHQNGLAGGTDMANYNSSGASVSGVYADVTVGTWATYALPATFPTATINASTGTPRVGFRPSVVVN